MSSVECLREFVTERLTAAAEEIFRVVEKTIVEYEEEIARQRRLLDVVWKPEIKLHRIELPQQHVCNEEEVLSDQQLCIQERNSSLDQEDPEPPQIKEEQEELCPSQEGEQLVLKQETDTFMLTPTYEESDHSEGQTLNFNPDDDSLSAAEKESVANMPVITSVVSEANSDHQLLSHNSHEAESQDQKGGKHGDSGSTRNAEPEPKKRRRKSRSHSNNVDNTNVSEIHPNTQTELPQQHVCKEEVVLSDQQLCIQERNSSLDQEDPEPPQIKEEQEELCTSQEGEQLVLKQETDTFMLTPTYEESDHSEGQTLNFNPDDDSLSAAEKESVANMPVITSVVSEANSDHQLLSHNSHEAESQDQKGGKHGDSESTRNAEPEPKKRRRKSRSHSNNVDNTNVSEIHPNTQTELPQQHVCKEEEVLSDQQLCIQEKNSSLDQEDPEPPQIKEEQEELCTSQEGEQLVLKQETDTFMLTPTYEESDHSEGQTLNFNPDDDSLSAAEKESVANMPVITSVESEASSDHQLLSHNSHEAESQDQKGDKHGDSGSTRNAEPEPKKRQRKSRSHSNNVDNTNVSEIHPNTQTELPQQHVCKEEEVLSDQQLCIQERNSSLDQEDPEPPQIKEEQEELCPSQEGEQLVLKQETDTFMLTPTYDDSLSAAEKESVANMPVITSVVSEANSDHQLLSHNSHEAESQDQKGGKHGDSGSTRNAEPEPKKRRRKSRSHSNNVDNTNVSEIHPNTQTDMTLPRGLCCCPVCLKDFAALSNHLRRAHGVHNVEERKILLNLATRRVNVRNEACPVLGCSYHSTRLDKHLIDGHRELTRDEMEVNLDMVRRTKSISLLAALRRTNPTVRMSTGLDLEEEDEGDQLEVPGEAVEEAPQCPDPSSIHSKAEVKRLSARLQLVERELMNMRSKSQRLAKRLRRSQAMASARTGDTGSYEEGDGDGEDEVEHEEQPAQLTPQQLHTPQLLTPQPQQHRPPPQHTQEQPPFLLLNQQEMEQGPGTSLKNLFQGSGRSPGMRNLKFPPSIENYLRDYQRYHEGSCPTAKQLENALSKVSRVRSFIFYLAKGQTELFSWLFLRNIDGIQKYTAHLQSVGKTITTANFYLRNIQQFLKYFRETPPAQSRLTAMDVVSVLRTVKKCLTDITRNVVLHQLAVKSHKMARIISCEDLKRCQEGAKLRIPKLLDALEENHTPSLRYRFYGYFAAFTASIYGHRPGLLSNLRVSEVEEAAEAHKPGNEGFVISAKNNLPAKQRKMVATFMCLNTATADRFYALSLNVAQERELMARLQSTPEKALRMNLTGS
ncbi:uncharacterized protein LOC116058682 isoform X7 [Sander lucioperca]|uniref:uncharacterized protein LOC116058682 isoform X7 n=1 Tax=Sander lucioperca TaxID=283035 RepID=UPI00125DC0D9|nr:uncharacterized protein LOC116058682 isoform X7 [Sander lucioperca]